VVIRTSDFGSGGPGSIPIPGRHVVSFGKTLYSIFSDKDVKPEVQRRSRNFEKKGHKLSFE